MSEWGFIGEESINVGKMIYEMISVITLYGDKKYTQIERQWKAVKGSWMYWQHRKLDNIEKELRKIEFRNFVSTCCSFLCLSRHIQFSLLQGTLLHSFIVLAAKMTDILFHYFSALFWMLKAHIHSKWIEAFFITASSASPQFTCSTRSLLLFLETLMLLTLRTIRTLERGKMEEFKKYIHTKVHHC